MLFLCQQGGCGEGVCSMCSLSSRVLSKSSLLPTSATWCFCLSGCTDRKKKTFSPLVSAWVPLDSPPVCFLTEQISPQIIDVTIHQLYMHLDYKAVRSPAVGACKRVLCSLNTLQHKREHCPPQCGKIIVALVCL